METAKKVTNPFTEENESKRYDQYRPQYHHIPFEKISQIFGRKIPQALDVACGTGRSTRALAEISEKVIGCDISASMLSVAQAHSQLKYIISPAENLPFSGESFDYVHISMAYQWLKQEDFLSEARRVLKKDSYLGIDNYGFIGLMSGEENFKTAYKNFDKLNMPAVPRNIDYPSPEQMHRFKLSVAHEIRYPHLVMMSKQEFVNYLMTRSNFVYLPGSQKESVENEMNFYYEKYFQGGKKELHFAGLARLYRFGN